MIDASVGPTPDRPLPSADEAISGWDTLIARDSRVVLPDDRMTALFDQSRGRLSLSTHDLASRISAVEAGAGDELAALCHGGMAREAIEVLRSLLTDLWVPPRRKRNTPAEPQAAVIDGIGWACAMYAPQWAEEFLPAAIQIAQSSAKRGSPAAAARAHSALARISAISGDHQAAASIDRSSGYGPWDEPATVASISERLQQASETGSWREDDATPAARALSDLRSLLVREDSIDGAPEIDLFPNFASAWRGGSVELHSIETAFGSVSAALRWHGYRPALLWEFERAEHVMVPVRVRCRALDPDWSSTDRKGDALLAGVAEDLGEAPEEGQSFI